MPDSCWKVRLFHIGLNHLPEIQFTINIPAQAKEFDLWNLRLDGFPTLPLDHTKLEFLSIQSSYLSDMPSFEDFTKLKEIRLDGNAFLVLNYLPFALQQIRVGGNPLICVKNKPPLVEDQLSGYPLCPPD